MNQRKPPRLLSKAFPGTEVEEQVTFDSMSEEDLLRGIENLSPPDRRDD